jgi:hypothetical protein
MTRRLEQAYADRDALTTIAGDFDSLGRRAEAPEPPWPVS